MRVIIKHKTCRALLQWSKLVGCHRYKQGLMNDSTNEWTQDKPADGKRAPNGQSRIALSFSLSRKINISSIQDCFGRYPIFFFFYFLSTSLTFYPNDLSQRDVFDNNLRGMPVGRSRSKYLLSMVCCDTVSLRRKRSLDVERNRRTVSLRC